MPNKKIVWFMPSLMVLIFGTNLSFHPGLTSSTEVIGLNRGSAIPTYTYTSFVQNCNETSGIQVDDLLDVIITICATIIGTFVGYVLSLQTTKHLEERKTLKTILKSLRGLISELEDDEKAVQVGRESKRSVWESVRRQYWFSSPIIGKQLQDSLKQIYDLLDDYDRQLSIVRVSSPAKVTEYAQKFVNESNLLNIIRMTRVQLQSIAEKISPKIVPSLGSE